MEKEIKDFMEKTMSAGQEAAAAFQELARIEAEGFAKIATIKSPADALSLGRELALARLEWTRKQTESAGARARELAARLPKGAGVFASAPQAAEAVLVAGQGAVSAVFAQTKQGIEWGYSTAATIAEKAQKASGK